MKLTALQKQFITGQLGVQPRKRTGLFKSTDQKTDEAIGQAAENYTRREGKVLKDLATLEKSGGLGGLIASFENEVGQIQNRIKGALRDAGEAVLREAYEALDAIKQAVRKEVDAEKANPGFVAKREAVKLLLDKLDAHAQAAHVKPWTDQARTDHAEAIRLNDAKQYPQATVKIDAAKKRCDEALVAAGKYNDYRIARAPATGTLKTMAGMYATAATYTGFQDKLNAADAKATLATGKYDEAIAAVKKIASDMSSTRKTWLDDDLNNAITELKKPPQADFIKDDSLKKLQDMLAAVPGQVASGDYAALNVVDRAARRELQRGQDIKQRREAFVQARTAAVQALAPLRTCVPLAARVGQLDTRLSAEADPAASISTMRFEEAISVCDAVRTEALALAPAAALATAVVNDLAGLDKRLEVLDQLAGARCPAAALETLKALRLKAGERAAPDTADWAGARVYITQLSTEMDNAENLAKQLDATAGVADAVQSGADVTALGKALEQLQGDVARLEAPPFPDLLTKELKTARTQLSQALKLLTEGAADKVGELIALVARIVADGWVRREQQRSADEALTSLRERVKALEGQTKAGSFKALAGKAGELKAELAKAEKAHKGGDATATQTGIASTLALAGEIDRWVEDIKAFDLRATDLGQRSQDAKSAGADVKAIDALLKKAAEALAKLDLAGARKHHDDADAELTTLRVQSLAKANPDDPAVVAQAEALLKLPGGDKKLDSFVQTLGNEADFGLICKLAEKRFGIQLDERTRTAPGDATTSGEAGAKTVSAKGMWEALAQVPTGHAKQPSLKKVTLDKPNSDGGAYNWADKAITMDGRPDDGKTENFDHDTRMKALGHDNQDEYAPIDDTGKNLFNMTALHEIGHAVDDRLGFMNGKMGQAAFGGWRVYTDLTPIAQAVAAAKQFDEGFVRQLINGQEPAPVVMPADYPGGAEKWAKARQAVLDWHQLATKGNIWYSYAKSKAAAIGDDVYQEAYANNWVSYKLAERAKGVTGYQWRAPGEWFAEVYMCWHGGKLDKAKHPFKDWLNAL
ncbi:hypothetical protein [Ideonella alba]|uniref:Uncharacterized protein n=1 Tax=Ideonella alba TaxID=2824118 RepID=A0A941BDP9_9BURK|nr:hypothetical protein [Ideonella alba]MBQ0930406.1 hypothetical protein [Ideonella alba]